MTEKNEEIIAFKGFDMTLSCRGFQYEIGKTYDHADDVRICERGFHACEYPLDIFGYYPPASSRFAIVKQSGDLQRHDEDTKIASAKITIEAELQLPDLIARAIKWVFDRSKLEAGSSATGDRGAASATGYRGAASATGYRGRAMGADGCALFLVYRDPNNGKIIHAWAGIAGRDNIKPLTWYMLGADGTPIELDSQWSNPDDK